MEIMEYPFCGESSENSLIVTDSRRQNLALNKSGKLHRQAVLECVVQCLGCGALSPLSPGFEYKEIDLTEIAELESKKRSNSCLERQKSFERNDFP
ncbi:hypothetical protein [Methylobacter tundripaludum]|jgi:hypothetical protein|uniref:hypothetical protein n=1 Tax=Methylobacter tundripaludum TaxID=173365 RepID=UPI001267D113|nr:hypothetical protein [Methylobacter tundripaludum]MDP1772442.1 hypothetical protein [Methylobacter sp.]